MYVLVFYNEAIFTLGTYQINVNQLQEPPEYLRVREVKDWYVDLLGEMLAEEAGDHEDLTAPLLVVAPVTKEDFKVQNVNKYTYQVRVVRDPSNADIFHFPLVFCCLGYWWCAAVCSHLQCE